MSVKDLMPFLYNIAKEAKKGYYNDNDLWIDGYCSAVEDILERIELDGEDNATE